MSVTTTTQRATSTIAAAQDRINGVDMPTLHKLIDGVRRDPANGLTRWGVSTRWVQGDLSETRVEACEIGGRRIARGFTICVDEPLELGGTNKFANPQEYLLAALNACMMAGYVALASLEGIELQSVEIETAGDIDLRGFLGFDPNVKAGYDHLHYTVRIRGNGTPEQFDRIHRTVIATSPNRFNIASPVRLTSDLLVDHA